MGAKSDDAIQSIRFQTTAVSNHHMLRTAFALGIMVGFQYPPGEASFR